MTNRLDFATYCAALDLLDQPGAQRIALTLYSTGMLAGAEVWHDDGHIAPFTWPTKKIALVLHRPIGSPYGADEDAYFDDARDTALQDQGWLVLRIDPDSPVLDEQLARIALLFRQAKPDRGQQS